MLKVVTAKEMQGIDRLTIDKYGLSGLVLMERAGLSVVEKIKEKDFKKAPFVAGYILYNETNFKWYNLVYTSFPYIIEYTYEKEISSLFFWPDHWRHRYGRIAG